MRNVFANKAAPFKTDIVIIGGGFAGLTTAIRILERAPEKRVTLLEAKFIGYGASGRNGGLMSPIPVPIWLASARNNADHAWATQYINKKVNAAGQWLQQTLPESGIQNRVLRLEAVGPITGAVVREIASVLDNCGVDYGARPNLDTGQKPELDIPAFTVHPYQLVQSLAKHAVSLGAEIIEDCGVSELKGHPSPGQTTNVALASGGQIEADQVIVCTNAYTRSPALITKLRAKPVHNYMMATRELSDQEIDAVANRETFTVELNKAYVFYRLYNNRIIFGGIEKLAQKSANDFDVPIDVLRDLKTHFTRTFPELTDVEIESAWGGKFHQTLTDLPIIRRDTNMPGVITNVGYGGTGVALTLTCASLVAAMALGNSYDNDDDRRLHHTINDTRLPVFGALRFIARAVTNLVRGGKFPRRSN